VLVGKVSLRDAVFVRDRSYQPLRRIVSVDIVKRVLKFFDRNLVEEIQ